MPPHHQMFSKTILIGTTVGVLSSATQSVGLTLQRKSHILEELRPPTITHRPPYKRPLWRLGFLLFLLANLLGSSIQITTLPLIILSPLQAVGLVFNSVCSAIILEEGFTLFSVAGTVLVGFGALLIAWFGSIEEPNHSLSELLELMQRWPFVAWILTSVSGVVLILLWISSIKVLRSKRRFEQMIPCVLKPAFDVPVEKFRFVKGCLYGVVSGTLSAHSLLLAKSAVELLLNAVLKSNYASFRNIRTWIIIGSFFVLAITQLVFLNKGLRFVSTSVLYPLVFCVYNITNIVNGLVFYNQLHILSKWQIFMIILGTMLVLLGVFALSWRLKDNFEEYKTGGLEGTHERSPLLGDHSFLNDDDDEETTGYVSFGSPKAMQDDPEFEGTSSPTTRRSQSSPLASPISKLKSYGKLSHDTSQSSAMAERRRSRRMLSYEQNELLAQLNNMPDMV